METAVYIQKLNYYQMPSGYDIEFERDEIQKCNVIPFQKSIMSRNQYGNSYSFILSDLWSIINIIVRYRGEVTNSKLIDIKNQMNSNLLLRIYPRYISDGSYFFDCIISPEVSFAYYFSGKKKAGDLIHLQFIECSKARQVVMDDDIITI